MEKETLDLWYAFPADFGQQDTFARSLALLSEGERQKAQLFKADASRHEYVAAHTLVRTALSYGEPVAPEAWRFRTNNFGKPHVDPACDLFFSLSRRSGLAACLVAGGGEVGVDVESHGRAGEILDIAHRVFSPSELAQLDRMSHDDKLDHALSLWTLKEAYSKARGQGFSLPMQRFSFLRCPGEGIRLEVEASIGADAACWQFCLLDHAGYRVALMSERRPVPRLRVWEMRPQEPSFLPVAVRAVWHPPVPE